MRPAWVAAVANEIGAWKGSRVRAFHQDGALAFRLALEGRAGRTDVVLALEAEFPRVHLAPSAPAPASPTALAAAFRSRVQGGRLEGARAVEGERAVVLAVRRGEASWALWYEGFGRGANLYLVDAGGRVELTVRGSVAAQRGAGVGLPFVPAPARPERADDGPPLPGGASPSEAVAAAARAHVEAQGVRRARTDLLRRLRAEVRRTARRVRRLEAMAARGEEAAEQQRRGELLQASFHLLAPGLERVRVPDVHAADEAAEVEVALDPRLPPAEQVAACFRAARRARRAVAQAEARREEAVRAHEAALGALSDAQEATSVEALGRIAEGLGLRWRAAATPRPKGPVRALPWRTYRSADGWRILVGRDAAGNDRLTLRHARPADLFLHVRGASGSHVIVPTPRGKTVPRDTLLDAAELACVFSARKRASWSEVDYALRRHVRKPRGTPAGTVVLSRAKTLRLRADDARRRRLLASRAE